MSRPDFTQFLIDTLDGWNTSNYDPKPTLIDGRDSNRQNSAERSRAHDLANGNAITVGGPSSTNEAIGTNFDLRFLSSVTVRCEGLIAAEFGDVDDAADWKSFEGEVERLVWGERVNPTTDDNVRWLLVSEDTNQSRTSRDYFRTDYTVEFYGFETLP